MTWYFAPGGESIQIGPMDGIISKHNHCQLLMSNTSKSAHHIKNKPDINALLAESCYIIPIFMWPLTKSAGPDEWHVMGNAQTSYLCIHPTLIAMRCSYLRIINGSLKGCTFRWQCAEGCGTVVSAEAQRILCSWDIPTSASLWQMSEYLCWFLLTAAITPTSAPSNGFQL